MVTKITLVVSMAFFVIFAPALLMLLNVGGFSETNIKIIDRISGDDFNLLSLSGFGTAFELILELGKFTVQNLHPLTVFFFIAMAFLSVIALIFLARGGGS